MIGTTDISSPEISPAASPRFPPPDDYISAAPVPSPVFSPSPTPPSQHITAAPPVPPPPEPPAQPVPPPEESPPPPAAPIPEVTTPARAVETPTETSTPAVDSFPPPPPPQSYGYSAPESREFLLPLPATPPPKSYSSPVTVTDATASPPFMLINGSSPPAPGPPKSMSPPSPSRIQEHVPKTRRASTGEMVGIGVGIGGFLCIFFILMLIFICKRKRNVGKVDDCESPPARGLEKQEKLYSVKHKHILKQNINASAGSHAHVSQALENPLLLSPSTNSHSTISEPENQFSPRVPGMVLGFPIGNFTYQELALATDGFSKSNLLGEGGFGYVHKGVLPTGGQIAVKHLKTGSRQGEREFQAEVETITRVHHRHLVSLIGYCIAGANKLLVYEFVPNQTVSFHLHGKARGVMDWDTRLKIALGSAKGLAYLHEDCNPTIIHRDIKTSNILLDSKFEAKVSDFGLAKFFCDADNVISHVSTRVVGTFGYLAPEYALSGKASYKSDVFSFGVVLLELVTGLEPIISSESFTNGSLVSWARPRLRRALEDGNIDGLVDPHLQKNYDVQEMTKMVHCAAACVRQTSWRRPRMSQIVRALEGDIFPMDLEHEELRPGQSIVSGHCLHMDLKNMDKDISGLETTSSMEEIS